MGKPDHSLVGKHPLVIASRGSRLALWQAGYVRKLLRTAGYASEILVVTTRGDRIRDRFLHEIGGKGVFVREVEAALSEQRADLAVHSLKDLPVKIPEDYQLTAVLARDSPGDVMIFHPRRPALVPEGMPIDKEALRRHAPLTVGTGSLRRGSLLAEASESTVVVPLRGNVDTRIEKLRSGSWDAIVLAAASLERLTYVAEGMAVRVLEPGWFVPSPAQGALVIETLKGHPAQELLRGFECARTRLQVETERRVLALLGGDCTMPVGVYMMPDSCGGFVISAVVLGGKGRRARAELRVSAKERPEPGALAARVIELLAADQLGDVMADLGLPLPFSALQEGL